MKSHSSCDLATLTISEHVEKVCRSFATRRECLPRRIAPRQHSNLSKWLIPANIPTASHHTSFSAKMGGHRHRLTGQLREIPKQNAEDASTVHRRQGKQPTQARHKPMHPIEPGQASTEPQAGRRRTLSTVSMELVMPESQSPAASLAPPPASGAAETAASATV